MLHCLRQVAAGGAAKILAANHAVKDLVISQCASAAAVLSLIIAAINQLIIAHLPIINILIRIDGLKQVPVGKGDGKHGPTCPVCVLLIDFVTF